METLSVEPSFSIQTDRQTGRENERQADMVELIVAFRNIAKAPNNRLGMLRNVIT
jgi:hypothetical protein